MDSFYRFTLVIALCLLCGTASEADQHTPDANNTLTSRVNSSVSGSNDDDKRVDFHRWFPNGLKLLGDRTRSQMSSRRDTAITIPSTQIKKAEPSTTVVKHVKPPRLNAVFHADRQVLIFNVNKTAKPAGSFFGRQVTRDWGGSNVAATAKSKH